MDSLHAKNKAYNHRKHWGTFSTLKLTFFYTRRWLGPLASLVISPDCAALLCFWAIGRVGNCWRRLRVVQGISHWNVRLYMVLRDGRINNFVDFSLKACSGVVGIWVLSINFYINDIVCPPQPQVWRMPKLNLKFHDSNRKKSCLETNKIRCF